MKDPRSGAGRTRTKNMRTDVIIVGGGHAGCTMAALLSKYGVETVCIDRDDITHSLSPAFDGRTTAISYGSRNVIDAAGAWDALKDKICPIENIHVTQEGAPTLLHFLAAESGAEAYGWIVENRHLRQSLYAQLHGNAKSQHIPSMAVTGIEQDKDNVCAVLSNGARVQGKLLIGADGRNSFVRAAIGIGTRGWSYRQRALVCVAQHDHDHGNGAVEDFRPNGPLAILPMLDDDQGRHRSALVWTEHCAERHSAMRWDEDSFNAALNARFPDRYGYVKLAGPRMAYPLGLIHAHQYTAPRVALIADAAHGIHPIAGQGLNLGLRDIADLAERIIDAKQKGSDIGGDDVLDAYQRARQGDNMLMAGATDLLNKVFSNGFGPLHALRRLGLKATAHLPSVQNVITRQAMGMGGQLPSLVRTGKFSKE